MARGAIECQRCGHENEYDTDDDTILCEECYEMLFILGNKTQRVARYFDPLILWWEPYGHTTGTCYLGGIRCW